MKLKLEEVREAFAVIDAVSPSPVTESSQFARLRAQNSELTMTMTGTLWAEAKVKGSAEGGKWTVYAERRSLKAFLATATGEELELFYKDKLILRAGQRLEVASHSPISGYESWTPKAAFDLTDDQKTALKTMVKYLPNIAGSEHVEAIFFDKDYGIIATDTLCIMAILGETGTPSFFLPAGVAQVLASTEGKIGSDKSGVGIIKAAGFVYQPLSADLDRFPSDKCKNLLETAQKTPIGFKAKASDLACALNVAGQFLLDKADSARVESKVKGGLLVSVDFASGIFQRSVPIKEEKKLSGAIQWPLRRVIPWLEYIASRKTDVIVEYAKMANASVFRFEDGKQTHLFVFADI